MGRRVVFYSVRVGRTIGRTAQPGSLQPKHLPRGCPAGTGCTGCARVVGGGDLSGACFQHTWLGRYTKGATVNRASRSHQCNLGIARKLTGTLRVKHCWLGVAGVGHLQTRHSADAIESPSRLSRPQSAVKRRTRVGYVCTVAFTPGNGNENGHDPTAVHDANAQGQGGGWVLHG